MASLLFITFDNYAISQTLLIAGRLTFQSSCSCPPPPPQRGNAHPILPAEENQQFPQQSGVSALRGLGCAALGCFLLAKRHDVHLVDVFPKEGRQGAKGEWPTLPRGDRGLLPRGVAAGWAGAGNEPAATGWSSPWGTGRTGRDFRDSHGRSPHVIGQESEAPRPEVTALGEGKSPDFGVGFKPGGLTLARHISAHTQACPSSEPRLSPVRQGSF